MRFKLALALSISVLLIGAASWYRFVANDQSKTYVAELAPVENLISNKDLMLAITDTNTNSDTTTSSPRTEAPDNISLLSRSLFLDYINLAGSGEATSNDLNTLAEEYVDKIPGLHNPKVVSLADLKIVADSKTNFQSYSAELVSIYNSYTQKVNTAYPGSTVSGLDPTFYAFVLIFSDAYTEAATRLQITPVPTSLATLHRDLINNYLSGALAMSEISKTKEDPAIAFAGVIALKNNLNKENLLISQINQTLVSYGI